MKQNIIGLMVLLILIFTFGAPQAAEESVTVAVFEFEGEGADLKKAGLLIREMVEINLAMAGKFKLVTRIDIDKILTEYQFNLSGLTDESAPQIGKLLGAQVMIVGRVFLVGDRLIVTGRIIGTDTGRTYGAVVRGNLGDADQLGEELGAKLAVLIEEKQDTLVVQVKLATEQIADLKKKIGKQKLPVVFVHIQEQNVGTRVIDPAAQTEVEYVLMKAGFQLYKDKSGALKSWAEEYIADGGIKSPPVIEGLDVVLIGEGISEFAARNGELVSSRARVELEALHPKSGKLLAVDRETFVAVDLAEQIAAKSALQESAARLIYRLLPEAVKNWKEQSK